MASASRLTTYALFSDVRAAAGWGLIVTGVQLIGSLRLFVGLPVAIPGLGHSTWRLYRKLVVPELPLREHHDRRSPRAGASSGFSRRAVPSLRPGAGIDSITQCRPDVPPVWSHVARVPLPTGTLREIDCAAIPANKARG